MADELSSGRDGAPGPQTRSRRSNRAVAVRGGASARTPVVARYSRRDDSVSPSSRNSSMSRCSTPVSRGNYGVRSAMTELRAAAEEQKEAAFNRFLQGRIGGQEARTAVLDAEEEPASEESCREDPTKLGVQELRAWAGRSTASLIQMAGKSSNLKGTYVKKFKEAASELQAIVEALSSRTEAEETRRLRADNARLRSELDLIRTEQKAYRRDFAEMKTAMAKEAARAATRGAGAPVPPAAAFDADVLEELKASIVASVGTMLDARFAGIEERLLPEKVTRPPLSSDRRGPPPSRSAGTSQAAPARSGGLRTSVAPATPGETPARAGPSRAAQPEAETWSEVVGRKTRGKNNPGANPASSTPRPPPTAAPKRKPSLAPPKTAAVIITLAPEAVSRGVTYAQVLEQAEQRVNLGEIGIGAGMRIRRSATGARLLELPKENTQDQAELLAGHLRKALEGVAEVVRPTKTATLRVTGLDDSATAVKVAAAVARAGGCSIVAVRATPVQRSPMGMGSSTVYCPVDAGKKVCEAGRLLVGWSSVRVQALEQRPLRCYRCLGMGHTVALCTSETDRSKMCYRCGEEGHRHSGCSSQSNRSGPARTEDTDMPPNE
ncbi:protein MLP1 homolog [Pararge aegeria]|uniref:protein MLP1 homolog n=1 Tax=Pararge aegeria TaxID=116150 RepID=UPI0019D04C4B|nr:protein MLP1 homolog [Pararge aegeria]